MHSWSSILWWRLCLASDLLNVSLWVGFICFKYQLYMENPLLLGGGGGGGLISTHSWSSILWWRLCLASDLLNISLWVGFIFFFINVSYIWKIPFYWGVGGRGPDHLAQLEKHLFDGWRLCLASDLLNTAYWGKGGGVCGGGENVLFLCVTICIVLLCLSMHVCDIDFCS